MAVEWVATLGVFAELAEKIFGGLSKYGKMKSEDRSKLATVLDAIANELIEISDKLSERHIDNRGYGSISGYRALLPQLLERSNDEEVSSQLMSIMERVHNLHDPASELLSRERMGELVADQIEAITASIEASAGTISATAKILRAL